MLILYTELAIQALGCEENMNFFRADYAIRMANIIFC